MLLTNSHPNYSYNEKIVILLNIGNIENIIIQTFDKTGQHIDAGTKIGEIRENNNLTFGLFKDGKAENPQKWLSK